MIKEKKFYSLIITPCSLIIPYLNRSASQMRNGAVAFVDCIFIVTPDLTCLAGRRVGNLLYLWIPVFAGMTKLFHLLSNFTNEINLFFINTFTKFIAIEFFYSNASTFGFQIFLHGFFFVFNKWLFH